MLINNTQNIIDSRDIIERIEELQAEFDANEELVLEEQEEMIEEKAEIEALEALAKEGEEYAPDWNYGEALIHEDYFTEYCKDLCDDIGALPEGAPAFITDSIDWDGVAEDLKVDYTELDYDGQTYYIR